MEKTGNLYLIPTVIGNDNPQEVIPEGVLEVSRKLKYFIAENDKTARRYLKKAGTTIPLDDLEFGLLNKHTSPDEYSSLIRPLLQGHDMGLISEAGLPAIADPGAHIVKLCHQKGIRVLPQSGPSSILLALIASGFNGQSFTFHGYLPIEKSARSSKIKEMERVASQTGYTQIFMETPFRNNKLMDEVLKTCNPTTLLCVAADITLESEFIRTESVAQWKKKKPDLHKRPCIFLLGE